MLYLCFRFYLDKSSRLYAKITIVKLKTIESCSFKNIFKQRFSIVETQFSSSFLQPQPSNFRAVFRNADLNTYHNLFLLTSATYFPWQYICQRRSVLFGNIFSAKVNSHCILKFFRIFDKIIFNTK